MPAGGSDIQHHSITNHRIPRHANEAEPPGDDDDMPMRLFHRNLVDAADPEVERDLGIALVERVERYAPPTRRALGALALARLESAARADPTDVLALDARAHARWAIGDFAGAATAFEETLERSPRREVTLQYAAVLALEQKRPQDAIGYLERAIKVNPWRHEFHHFLAEAHFKLGQLPTVLKECQKALRLNPADIPARRLLVEAHLGLAQLEQARAEFERLLGLHPPNEEALRNWFARRTGAVSH
jgi:tetratricopeptide (TPR) repeat protein